MSSLGRENQAGKRAPLLMLLFFFLVVTAHTNNAAAASLPPVKWPAGVSSFCKMVLNSCFKNCFQILKHKQSPSQGMFGQMSQASAIANSCFSRCWNSPFRKRMCKLQRKQLLEQGSKVYLRFAGEWKKEQTRLAQEKKYILLILRSERLRQKQLKKERKLRQKQLFAQQSKFKQEKQRLKEVQAELKEARREAIRKQNNTKELLKLKKEQRRLALARKLYKEEQKRLAIERKLALDRKQKAEKRKKAFQQWVEKTKQLREQSKLQLAKLKQQADQEKRQLQELKQLKQKKEALQQQKRTLDRKREQAKSQRLHDEVRRLAAEKARLLKAMKSLQRKHARVKRRRQRSRRARKKRIRKLARLHKQRTRHRRTWKVRTKRRRDYRFYFQKGDLGRAVRLSKGRERRKIHEFRRMYSRGRKSYKKREANRALPKLERALTLELEICKGKSTYHPVLKTMLGEMYVLKGIQSFSSQNFPTSYLYFSRSLRHTPNSRPARLNLRKLARIAKYNYQKALRNKSNRQIYLRLLRKALGCLPSNSKLAKEIRRRLY